MYTVVMGVVMIFILNNCVSTLIVEKGDEIDKNNYVVSDFCKIKSEVSTKDYSIKKEMIFKKGYLDINSELYDVAVFITEKKDIAYEVNSENKFMGNVYFRGLRWYHKTNITSDCNVIFEIPNS